MQIPALQWRAVHFALKSAMVSCAGWKAHNCSYC